MQNWEWLVSIHSYMVTIFYYFVFIISRIQRSNRNDTPLTVAFGESGAKRGRHHQRGLLSSCRVHRTSCVAVEAQNNQRGFWMVWKLQSCPCTQGSQVCSLFYWEFQEKTNHEANKFYFSNVREEREKGKTFPKERVGFSREERTLSQSKKICISSWEAAYSRN